MGKKWRIAHQPNSQRRGKTPKLLFIISAPPPPPPQQQQRPLIHSVYICSLLWIRTQQQPPHTHTQKVNLSCERAESALCWHKAREKFFQRIKNCTIHHPLLCRLRHVGVCVLLAKWRKRVRARAQRRVEGRAAAALAKVNALHAIQP